MHPQMTGPAVNRPATASDPSPADESHSTLALATRALGSLYLAGALIGLISLLLPHAAGADDAGLYSNVALAAAGGLLLLARGSRLPRWTLHLWLVAGTALITRAILLSHDALSFYSVWFIWVGLYAFYFLARSAAAVHVSLVALAYGWTLAHMHASTPVARWLTTLATLIVAGVFIDTLVRRARRQASAASAEAARMARLAEFAHELAAVSDSEAARPTVCAAAARVLGAAGVALWEPAADRSTLAASASWGTPPVRRAVSISEPPEGGARAFASGRMVAERLDRGTGSSPTPGESSASRGESSAARGACLWQPITRDQAPIAVLWVYWEDPSALDLAGLATLLDLLCAEVSVTLERLELLDRLEQVARTDELTGLPNRRAWQEALPRELARARRAGEPVCVAMLDLDHFKQFNDLWGHQAGDRLLKQVAGAWSDELRASDLLARYGGEEFALLLPACDSEQAERIIERLRAVIPEHQTSSAGLASWDGAATASELIGCADDALYEAKRRGRNRVVRAEAVRSG
jgi:diguanylate cyclase (GGDEF)-like protein